MFAQAEVHDRNTWGDGQGRHASNSMDIQAPLELRIRTMTDAMDKTKQVAWRQQKRGQGGDNSELTIQAHAGPYPSDRDLPVRRQRTRNLMEDWKPWLDITLQKKARRGKKARSSKGFALLFFGRYRD